MGGGLPRGEYLLEEFKVFLVLLPELDVLESISQVCQLEICLEKQVQILHEDTDENGISVELLQFLREEQEHLLRAQRLAQLLEDNIDFVLQDFLVGKANINDVFNHQLKILLVAGDVDEHVHHILHDAPVRYGQLLEQFLQYAVNGRKHFFREELEQVPHPRERALRRLRSFVCEHFFEDGHYVLQVDVIFHQVLENLEKQFIGDLGCLANHFLLVRNQKENGLQDLGGLGHHGFGCRGLQLDICILP